MTDTEKIAALKHENSLLRDLARQHESDREARETYERYLTEIGQMIGCGHIDDRLPSCVSEALDGGKDAIRMLQTIYRRQGIMPQGLQEIERFLRTVGKNVRQG